MPRPSRRPAAVRGELTPAQHEIMTIVWEAGPAGLAVGDIWRMIADLREVARTTVLTLVERLEKRGWLRRQDRDGVVQVVAAVDRRETESRLAADFVAGFFGGSSLQLVQSLLGSRSLSADEIARMEKLLAEARRKPRGRSPGGSR